MTDHPKTDRRLALSAEQLARIEALLVARPHPCVMCTADPARKGGRREGHNPLVNGNPAESRLALTPAMTRFLADEFANGRRFSPRMLARLARRATWRDVLHGQGGVTGASERRRRSGMPTTPTTGHQTTGPALGGPPETDDTYLGLVEAARACGVHVDTLRRALRRRRIPGAVRGPGANNSWRLPLAGLRAAGFAPDLTPPARPSVPDALRQAATALAVLADALEVRP